MSDDPAPRTARRPAVQCGICKRGIGTRKELVIRNGRVMHSRCFHSLLDTILQLLSHRPSQALCAQCIAQGAGVAVTKVQSVIMKIEARGARRHYGRCTGCGKQRLLAMMTGRARRPPPVPDELIAGGESPIDTSRTTLDGTDPGRPSGP